MERLLWLLFLAGSCRGSWDTEEAMAHYIVTNPPTEHPLNSQEKRVYKDIEDAIQDWQMGHETQPPSVDSDGNTMTPEPRAPRWWNQYMQEKYGDPPVFPDWSNETQIEQYMKNKTRKKWTPSQESFEPMRPNEEPFTWKPFIRDPTAWTQPTWDKEEMKRLGEELDEKQNSGGSYIDEREYVAGDFSDSNSTDVSHDQEAGARSNKSASALRNHRRDSHRAPSQLNRKTKIVNVGKQRRILHGPAQFRHSRGKYRPVRCRSHEARRRDELRAQLSPQDVKTPDENTARRLELRKEYERVKKNEVLRKMWKMEIIKKLREGIGVHQPEGVHQEYKAKKRRPPVGGVRNNLQRMN